MVVEGNDAKSAELDATVDNQLELSVKLLRQGGLLQQDRPAEMVWAWGDEESEEDVLARASWRPHERQLAVWLINAPPSNLAVPLSLTDPLPSDACTVAVEKKRERGEGKLGGEPWSLICPINQSRCRTLFWRDGRLGSRGALGLGYRTESALARRLRRHLGETRAPIAKRPVRILSIVARAPPKQPTAGADRFSTREAMGNSYIRGKAYDELREQFMVSFGDELKQAGERPLPKAPDEAQIDVWEFTPRIELKALIEAGYVKDGASNLSFLEWEEPSYSLQVAISIDLRDASTPTMVILTRFKGESLVQAVRLVRRDAPNDRWRMLCPESGASTNTLAFRFGRWASQKAQKLVYRSQRSARFSRHSVQGYRALPKR